MLAATTAQLNPPHIFILVILKKFHSVNFLLCFNGFLWRPENESIQTEVRIRHGAAHVTQEKGL